MKNDLLYVLSVRIEELANELSKRHSIQGELVDTRLDGDTLSLYLKPLDRGHVASSSEPESASSANRIVGARANVSTRFAVPKRRARRSRNRMRTRGWSVVGQVINKYGQKANIYQPFVEALKDGTLTRAEQRSVVSKILRSNGNTPSGDSVDYFLENTLEYLRGQAATRSLST